MTPQERQLISDLFERLAALENQPRDPQAEQAIREGLGKAPHALYPLVQSVLVQDEALKAANAHIEDLEAALQGQQQPKGFRDSMRDSLFGRSDPRGAEAPGGDPRGSVPSVRPGEQPMGVPPQHRGGGAPWGAGAQPAGPLPQDPYGRGGGGGGSFLGTAAAAAAGVIGGGLLLNGIRNMLGNQQHGGPFAGAFDQIASGGAGTPLGGGGDLAREAGLNDMGRGDRSAGLFDAGGQDQDYQRSAGLYDTADEAGYDDSDAGDDLDGGSDDTGYA
jgi:uncharacterized protein